MIERTKRKTSFENWRLCLQTSGIYCVRAIPCGLAKSTSNAKAGAAHWVRFRLMVWPRKSALRLHPCRALSSAPVSMSLAQDQAITKLVVVVDREE